MAVVLVIRPCGFFGKPEVENQSGTDAFEVSLQAASKKLRLVVFLLLVLIVVMLASWAATNSFS